MKKPINQKEILALLKRRARTLKSMGATALYVFGSVARNEATRTSDVDIFIDIDARRRFSLIDLVAMQNYLQDALHMKVDITTRDGLHPMLRRRIEHSAVRVF